MPLDRKTVIRVLMTERDRLYAYIWSLIGDVHLAEDVLQEVSLLAADKADEVSNEQALATSPPPAPPSTARATNPSPNRQSAIGNWQSSPPSPPPSSPLAA